MDELAFLNEPEDHTDEICTCGDPDCSRIMGHEDPLSGDRMVDVGRTAEGDVAESGIPAKEKLEYLTAARNHLNNASHYADEAVAPGPTHGDWAPFRSSLYAALVCFQVAKIAYDVPGVPARLKDLRYPRQ